MFDKHSRADRCTRVQKKSYTATMDRQRKMKCAIHCYTCRSKTYFFFPPPAASFFCSHDTTLPSMTTPFPSINATRESPSQFLKVSHTSGCWGWKLHSAISFDFNAWGSSIFLPPVSLPIFHLRAEIRQADRPQRTKPMGE